MRGRREGREREERGSGRGGGGGGERKGGEGREKGGEGREKGGQKVRGREGGRDVRGTLVKCKFVWYDVTYRIAGKFDGELGWRSGLKLPNYYCRPQCVMMQCMQ